MTALFIFVCAFSVASAQPSVQKLAAQAGALFEGFVTQLGGKCAPSCPFLRAAHVKQHGCMVGTLAVEPNLPPALAQGVFDTKTQGKSVFDVLVRFSNGKGNGFTPGYAVAPDTALDVRGMALKVFGVQGAKLHQPNAETQDFIAITAQTLFMEEQKNALPFFQHSLKNSSLSYYGFLALHPILATRLVHFAQSGNVHELHNTEYFTIAPLSMGSKAARFRFTPCQTNGRTFPLDTSSTDFLRNNLKTYFHTQFQSACWNVTAALYRDPTSTPIEDLTAKWNAPWQTVATLTVEPQDVWSSSTKENMCRQIAFHPKQTVAANKPQGWVQTVRDQVYTKEQTKRHAIQHQMNKDWTSATLTQYKNA